MIRVFCSCGRAFKAEDRHAGRHTKCPECGAGLVIGQVPVSSSSGSDMEEVPSWWYPTDSPGPVDRATAPTRSGSDPDSKHTMVLPTANNPKDKPQASSHLPPAVTSSGTQASPPKAPNGARIAVPARPAVSVKKLWALAGGTLALAVLAVGAVLWFRTATPGGDAVLPAPRETAVAKTNIPGPSKVAPPSVPTVEPKSSENRIASKSTSDGSTNPSLSRPPADVAGQPKSAPSVASGRLRLLVPAYIYPVDEGRKEWLRMIDAASKVEIVAIVNPSSGPGDDRNLDYAAIFTEASNHGITLVGYVSTNYGKRPKAEVRKDVDAWVRFYPQIRGFFFDQQPREGREAAYFVELRDYAKQKLRDPLVITNPGVLCDALYLALAVSNVTCVFSNYQGFDQLELPTTLKVYDASRFAALPYNVANAETMRTMVKEAILKRIGYLYVSDAKPPNQWGKLPAYWDDEVDAVSRLR
jgi:Spherulation-specific family 4